MSLRDKIKLKTELPDKASPSKPFNWKKLFTWLFFIGMLVLVFFVPHPVIFYYSTVISMSVTLVVLLLVTLTMLTPLAELEPGHTSFHDRFFTLFRLIKLNAPAITMVMLVLCLVFSWAVVGVPWLVEQIIGPYVCPPGYNEMTFKTSVTRLPIFGYAIAYSFEGYCTGPLGIFRGIRLLHFFIALMGTYFILVLLCFIAVMIVRLIQPTVMIKSKTVGPAIRTTLVILISVSLWAGLLVLPKVAPSIPHSISRIFNLMHHYNTHLHSEVIYSKDVDSMASILGAYPYMINRANLNDTTPLAIALRNNNLVAIDMLRRYDAKVKTRWSHLVESRNRTQSKYYTITFRILEEIDCETCRNDLEDRAKHLHEPGM